MAAVTLFNVLFKQVKIESYQPFRVPVSLSSPRLSEAESQSNLSASPHIIRPHSLYWTLQSSLGYLIGFGRHSCSRKAICPELNFELPIWLSLLPFTVITYSLLLRIAKTHSCNVL